MSETRCDARFNPVGQGLFYTAILSTKVGNRTHHFSMVYDCGTTTKTSSISEQIQTFKSALSTSAKTNPHKVLDLLVISHFHDDHVNHIPELLKRVHVRTVMIPFCTLSDRIINCSMSETDDEDVRQLITNPIRYFQNQNVNQIITYSPSGTELQPRDYFWPRFNNDFPDTLYEEYPFQELAHTHTEDVSYYSIQAPQNDSNRKELFFASVSQNLCARMVSESLFDWDFRFTMPNSITYPDTRLLQEINKSIEEYLLLHDNLDELFSTKRIKEIRKQYEAILGVGNLNENSVLCSHFPRKPMILSLSDNDSYGDYHFRKRFYRDESNGCTFLTGDYSFTAEFWKNLFSPSGILPDHRIDYLLIPHHGADTFIDSHEVFHAVVCYGINNSYGHPKYDTLRKLKYSFLYTINEMSTAVSYTILSADKTDGDTI